MTRLAIGIGVAAIVIGVIALLLGGGGTGSSTVSVLVAFLAIAGILISLWKLLETPGAGEPTVIEPPWTDDGALFDRPPERTSDDEALSGESFAAVLADAGSAARSEGTVEAGFEVVRPVLRRALVDALSLRDGDGSAIERALETGEWTDDRTAAAVLDPTVELPPWPIRLRIEAWLFPERVVRRQLQQTVQAIAEAANDAIPNVPGQNAPRNVPILQPRLEDLRRGVDGEVQRAVDPLATARGPRQPGSESPPIDVEESDRSQIDGQETEGDRDESTTADPNPGRETDPTENDRPLFVDSPDEEGSD